MVEFDIIEYLSGLTGFVFDKAVLKRIAMERDVCHVRSIKELDTRKKDLLLADLLYTAYLSPDTMASCTHTHGAYTNIIGSQVINDKKGLYNVFLSLYKKWNDSKLEEVQSSIGGLQWLE